MAGRRGRKRGAAAGTARGRGLGRGRGANRNLAMVVVAETELVEESNCVDFPLETGGDKKEQTQCTKERVGDKDEKVGSGQGRRGRKRGRPPKTASTCDRELNGKLHPPLVSVREVEEGECCVVSGVNNTGELVAEEGADGEKNSDDLALERSDDRSKTTGSVRGRRGRKRGVRGRGLLSHRKLPLQPLSVTEAEEEGISSDFVLEESDELAAKTGTDDGENSSDLELETSDDETEWAVSGRGRRGRKRGKATGMVRERGGGRGRGRGRGSGRGRAHVSNAEVLLPLALLPAAVEEKGETAANFFVAEESGDGIAVLTFDCSVENHFQAIDLISLICGLESRDSFCKEEIERFSSAITFLTEWKHFYYKPKAIRFAYETGSPQVKKVLNGICLSQFSSASVPKMERLFGNMRFMTSSKDFILHVGGHVWALDWCCRISERPGSHFKCEYLAVAAHPPDASYHKMGETLSGRGVIQIWCLLNVSVKEESTPAMPKRRGRKRLVRREPLDGLRSDEVQHTNAVLEGCIPDARLEVEGCDVTHELLENEPVSKRQRSMENKEMTGVCNDNVNPNLLTMNGEMGSSDAALHGNSDHDQAIVVPIQAVPPKGPLVACTSSSLFHKDVALPRLVMCLAHNGKVAWDVKWRPSDVSDREKKQHMGYLAVLLGNGSLEVWEVPFPSMIKILYTSLQKPGTDPRFVKLEPVFRCSKMQCGDRQSIPLTVEWSTSAPHDLLLVGCHDGTVSMLKFSANDSSQDTRPLLRFTADTVPIRALAWAPDESDAESANIIVTAGHEGLRLWDIRDPYRPLWDLNLVRKGVLSVDWLRDPRCVIVSIDDGTLRFLSLSKAAHDGPVTGKSFSQTHQQGLQFYGGLSFAIWSVQASQLTGQVAYCGADGSARCFQLSHKAVDKDASRYRAPHFLCGLFTEEDSVVTLNIPLPNTPVSMKKPPALNHGEHSSPAALKKKATPKDKTTSAKERKDPNTATDPECLNVAAEENPCGDLKVGNLKAEIEVFPPKIVALHRVRWNNNRGSERWLCYGGAAGIVRCQEIDLSTAPTRIEKQTQLYTNVGRDQ